MSANLPHPPQPFKVAAFYISIDHSGILSRQPALAAFCCCRPEPTGKAGPAPVAGDTADT
jgi:hypothetical protein